jgi:hypothetical protein
MRTPTRSIYDARHLSRFKASCRITHWQLRIMRCDFITLARANPVVILFTVTLETISVQSFNFPCTSLAFTATRHSVQEWAGWVF